MGKGSLSSLQSVVGVVAGLMSIAGAMYSAVEHARSAVGELSAVVETAGRGQRVDTARIEVLTPQDALVTTLTPGNDGRARGTLKEGSYVVRVSAPRFEQQTRPVAVQRGGTAEVRFALAPRAPTTVASAARKASTPIDRGVNAAQRFLHGLGL